MTRATLRATTLAAVLMAGSAAPSFALTFNTTFDGSVTSLANAAQVEDAFRTATAAFSNMFSNPVTVNLNVSWGSVNGQAMPSNALGSSSTSLYGYFNYGQIKSWLTGAATTAADRSATSSLPTANPLATGNYVLTSAQAKALKLVNPTSGVDGYIGFGGSSSGYDYNRADGIAANTYDFIGVVQHEVSEVLGRISGIAGAAPSYATALDLFRFGAAGQRSFSNSASAYFSVDNGKTDLADYNNSGSGGDRADWLSTYSTTDSADAFTLSGKQNAFSGVDQTALDIIGWNSTGTGAGTSTLMTTPGAASSFASVPEPVSLGVLATGLLGTIVARRRRRRA